jgi:hypothetical protein
VSLKNVKVGAFLEVLKHKPTSSQPNHCVCFVDSFRSRQRQTTTHNDDDEAIQPTPETNTTMTDLQWSFHCDQHSRLLHVNIAFLRRLESVRKKREGGRTLTASAYWTIKYYELWIMMHGASCRVQGGVASSSLIGGFCCCVAGRCFRSLQR